jgi:putative DNA primase/helicase
MLDAAAIHASLGADGWQAALVACGVDEKFLRNKHGPCPTCGGRDRFRFDNKGRGAFICNRCGAGDGFRLLMQVQQITFAEARKRVLEAARLTDRAERAEQRARQEAPEVSEPTRRVLTLLREACAIEDCEPARVYLESRALWPLPAGHLLRAHPSIEYWHDRQRIGRFPGLVTAIRDVQGELVTAHVTYLTSEGQKLQEYEPRKLLSALTGHEGCVAPIMEMPEHVLGIAEGIETALSASKLTGIPTWAAVNATLLGKFEPPHTVDRLVIFADRDVAGLEAASTLMERLQERVRLEIRTPRTKDWNDFLRAS